MDVSIVIPTRNRSNLLALTLRSVLCQRDVDLEVIIVDEASTDDTPALLASVRDPRVRVIRHDTPRGVSTARSRGAAEAYADWIGDPTVSGGTFSEWDFMPNQTRGSAIERTISTVSSVDASSTTITSSRTPR